MLVDKRKLKKLFAFLKNRRAKIYFGVFIIFPFVLTFLLIFILPLNLSPKLFDNENHIEISNDFTDHRIISKDDQLSSQLVELKVEEMFLTSQLQIAKSDSIGLVINLIDSSISLVIRGVKIRECKIKRFKISRAFKQAKGNLLFFNWLSEPFILQQEWATLVKVPIKVRKAPKDTLEAKEFKSVPFAIPKADVYFTLQFNRNLRIKVNQTESPTVTGRIKRWYYNRQSDFTMVVSIFSSLFQLKKPHADLWVELFIAQNDAKTIYRALPRTAALALKF